MNNQSRMKFAFLLFLSLLLFSTVSADTSVLQPNQAQEFRIFSETSDEGSIYAVLPTTSKSLSAETTNSLISISDDGANYRFYNNSSQLALINLGDVILSEGTPLAPYGFMRRVTDIWTEGDQIIFQTEQAVLTDVFHEASVSISQQITPAMISNTSLADGVSLLETNEEVPTFTFSKVLFDEDGDEATTHDQIKASGEVSVELSYDFDFEITAIPPSLDQLTFLVDVTELAALSVESGNIAFLDSEFEVELAKQTLSPIVIGGVPFVPEVTISVGLDGSIQADISSSVTQQFDFDGGVIYDGNEWDVLSDYTNSFSYELPELAEAQLEFKAFVGANVNFLIAGLPLGPSLSLKPYLLLTVDPTATPWWQLFGGLEIDLGMFLKPFGVTLVDLDFTLVDYDRLLARSWSNQLYLPLVKR